jgi:hypothetical protein
LIEAWFRFGFHWLRCAATEFFCAAPFPLAATIMVFARPAALPRWILWLNVEP